MTSRKSKQNQDWESVGNKNCVARNVAYNKKSGLSRKIKV